MANEAEPIKGAQENTEAPADGEKAPEAKSAEEKLADLHVDGKEPSKDEGTPPPQEKKKDEKPIEGIPDDWKPTLPEGSSFDDKQLSEARTFLKELKVSPEQAQKLAEYQMRQTESARDAVRESWEKQVKAWEDALRSDPEFKDGFAEKESVAQAAFKEFFTEEERKYLVSAGLTPFLFRGLYKVGLKVAEPSKIPEGKNRPGRSDGDPYKGLERMFGSK
jgi:hypothetical protein